MHLVSNGGLTLALLAGNCSRLICPSLTEIFNTEVHRHDLQGRHRRCYHGA
jgi:hypothetical protein